MSETKTELSNCYRVTDLPRLTDLDNQDLFLISHVKDAYGNCESQAIPFKRLMNAVKRRGFKVETEILSELNADAVRKNELTPYAKTEDVEATARAAKAYIDQEVSKIHTHPNKEVLDGITGLSVSQWENDAGYLASGDFAMSRTSDGICLSAGSATLSVDTRDFVKDSALDAVTYDASTKTLVFEFNEDDGKSPISVDMSDLVDVYTPGNGLTETDRRFDVDLNVVASKAWIEQQGFQKRTVFRDWTEA